MSLSGLESQLVASHADIIFNKPDAKLKQSPSHFIMTLLPNLVAYLNHDMKGINLQFRKKRCVKPKTIIFIASPQTERCKDLTPFWEDGHSRTNVSTINQVLPRD